MTELVSDARLRRMAAKPGALAVHEPITRDEIDAVIAELLTRRATATTQAAQLERLRAWILSHGECHSQYCGDDPALPTAERHAFIKAHADICTCGIEDIWREIAATVEGDRQ